MSVDLGKAIVDAVRFIEIVRQDVDSVFGALDDALLERAWRLTKSTNAPWFNNHRNAFRLYVPALAENDSAIQMIGAFVDLDPPSPCDVAVCLLVAARFDFPKHSADVWKSWNESETKRVVAALDQLNKLLDVPADFRTPTFMMSPARAVAIITPLAEIRTAQEVHARLADPVLCAAGGLI